MNSVNVNDNGMNIICDECAIDRMMLENYGIEVTEELGKRINESLARNDSEKLFGIDGFLVFNTDDTADYVNDNDMFGCFVDDDFYPSLDSHEALCIIERWSPEFMTERLKDSLNSLDKGEILRYDDLFRGILELDNENTKGIRVRYDDGRFEKMPKIVRIF